MTTLVHLKFRLPYNGVSTEWRYERHFPEGVGDAILYYRAKGCTRFAWRYLGTEHDWVDAAYVLPIGTRVCSLPGGGFN